VPRSGVRAQLKNTSPRITLYARGPYKSSEKKESNANNEIKGLCRVGKEPKIVEKGKREANVGGLRCDHGN